MIPDNIRVGCYGWQYRHWQGGFYPDDLPPDWQLAYYANEFDCVMVPAHYWQRGRGYVEAEAFAELHSGFRLYIECPQSMTDDRDFALLCSILETAQAQLAGIVTGSALYAALNNGQRAQLAALAPLYGEDCPQPTAVGLQPVWRPAQPAESTLAVFDQELSDLKQVRSWLEPLTHAGAKGLNDLIVQHRQPVIEQLHQLKTLVQLMGL